MAMAKRYLHIIRAPGWYNFRLGPWYGIKVGAALERQQRKQNHRVKDGLGFNSGFDVL